LSFQFTLFYFGGVSAELCSLDELQEKIQITAERNKMGTNRLHVNRCLFSFSTLIMSINMAFSNSIVCETSLLYQAFRAFIVYVFIKVRVGFSTKGSKKNNIPFSTLIVEKLLR